MSLVEVLKIIVLGIVEGFTEWLPISSTGHMILVDEIIHLNQPDAFKDVFLVVIQLGAILAVVIMYFNRLNPFSRQKTSRQRDATWALWIKIVVACVPAAVLGLLVVFLPQNPERTVGLIVTGMILCELFSAVTLLLLARRHLNRAGGLTGAPLEHRQLNRRIASIAVPIGLTSLLGNLMGSATSVLIPQRLVHAGAEVSEAMSAFGVLCGMTLPMLCLPTAFIGALGLVLVPKLAEGAALGQRGLVQHRVDRSMLATSVLILPAMAFLVVLGPTLGAALFREPTVGRSILPLSVGVLLSCYQSVLASALNGVGRPGAAARNSILCGVVQLGCTFFLMGLPGVGLRGYVAGFLASAALGVLLNWWAVRRATGLRAQIFQWCTAPALSALLMGLVINLLFQVLRRAGLEALPAALACLLFGGVLYLAALQAQGIHLRRLFRLC